MTTRNMSSRPERERLLLGRSGEIMPPTHLAVSFEFRLSTSGALALASKRLRTSALASEELPLLAARHSPLATLIAGGIQL